MSTRTVSVPGPGTPPMTGNPLARCGTVTNPEIFYPARYESWLTGVAKAICRRCPLIDACGEWAVEHEPHGIWAATTPEERAAIRRAGHVGTGRAA